MGRPAWPWCATLPQKPPDRHTAFLLRYDTRKTADEILRYYYARYGGEWQFEPLVNETRTGWLTVRRASLVARIHVTTVLEPAGTPGPPVRTWVEVLVADQTDPVPAP